MTRFSDLKLAPNGDLVETNIREIKQSDMQRCPHFIMVPAHYRADGTCRCDDVEHTAMRDWGYRWDTITQRWIVGRRSRR